MDSNDAGATAPDYVPDDLVIENEPTLRGRVFALIQRGGMTRDEILAEVGIRHRRKFEDIVASLRDGRPVGGGRAQSGPDVPQEIICRRVAGPDGDARYEYSLPASVDDGVDYAAGRSRTLRTSLRRLRTLLVKLVARWPEDPGLRSVNRHVRNALEELDDVDGGLTRARG